MQEGKNTNHFYWIVDPRRGGNGCLPYVGDHVWSIDDLIAAASTEAPIADGRRFGRFRAIDGGLSQGEASP
jgi:hypothetical protein